MNRTISSRIWTVAGIGVAVIVGLGLLLAFLGREPSELAPMITPAAPPQSDEPIVASVDGRAISRSSWMEAVLLDQVLSGLAGQPAPTSDETLQRLINEELVLRATPSEQAPTAEQIEARISTLEQTWSVDDDAVAAALQSVGLSHTVFEQAIGRLLRVEAGLASLESQGYDTETWLEQQRASAEIQIFESAAGLSIPTARSPISTQPTPPLPAPAAATEAPTLPPTPVPATEVPSATPLLADLGVAPDFTLERAGGGTLTLTEQLAQGPVVLVFFQKCG